MVFNNILIFALLLFFLCGIYYGVPWFYGKYLRKQLSKKVKKAKVLALTFDDGPSEKLTLDILDMLHRYNAVASFFLLGRNVVAHQDIARRIADCGHEICSHGYDHLHYWKVFPFRVIIDIKSGWQAIDKALGRQGGKYIFRPPNGKLTLFGLLYLLFLRIPIVYWTIDSTDTWLINEQDSSRLGKMLKKEGGIVALSHDFERSDNHINTNVINSLKLVLETAKEMGVRTITISQMLAMKGI